MKLTEQTFEILSRWSGVVIATIVAQTLKAGLELLVSRDADLGGADLGGADLGGANLGDANLRDANLRDANLGDANLRDANLRDADLGGADLGGANLRDADLRDANLRDANLRDADLGGANLGGANLGSLKGVPLVENLHQKILAAIDGGGELDMSDWHTCETTHCRAGWAVHLAGDAGAALEFGMGPATAGALITLKACPWMKKVPNFHTTDGLAMADIRACAEREKVEAAKDSWRTTGEASL